MTTFDVNWPMIKEEYRRWKDAHDRKDHEAIAQYDRDLAFWAPELIEELARLRGETL
jgi:folate-dependent tRNA-U54 methylase TrmFO/GidA